MTDIKPTNAAPRPPAQAFDIPLDAHVHTDLSPDSGVPLELYCAQAAERGVREIAITDHLDFMPGAPAYQYASYKHREKVIRDAAERWAGKVIVRFGVELTYESRYEDQIREHLATHSYDYTIGSVHGMSDGPYARGRIASFVAGKSLPEVVAPYFAEVAAAIRSGLFDTLGHMDMCKRWLVPWFRAADFAAAPELYEPLLVALVDSGTAARKPLTGEFGWTGGVVRKGEAGLLIAAFSGGPSEDDVKVSRAGLDVLSGGRSSE